MPADPNQQLQAIVRGMANHHRIALLGLLADQPGLSLDACATQLGMNVKTASGHLRELTLVGMVDKQTDGRVVHHTLTDRGHAAAAFLDALRDA